MACTTDSDVRQEVNAITGSPGSVPRNLIIMIGDGMGPAQVSAFRAFRDDPETVAVETLPVDSILVGNVRTKSMGAPWVVVDSAAAATAYATGQPTWNEVVGLDASGEPLETLFERARRQDMGVGIAVTSEVTHATPASFLAHVDYRKKYARIADQLFDNQIDGRPIADILLGGGRTHLQREDRNLVGEFENAGYRIAMTASELTQSAGSDLVLGLFAPRGLPAAWDRDPTIPSLAEMTRFALESLSGNRNGFVLLVEGSQIDWAGHDNQIAKLMSEMGDFMDAIEVALDFAEADGETLVMITADHETGGLSLGVEDHPFVADEAYVWDPRPLQQLDGTPLGMVIGMEPGQSLLEAATHYFPFELDAAERELLTNAGSGEDAVVALNLILDRRTGTGWSTGGHTGVDVPLYAYGPGSEALRGSHASEAVGIRLNQLMFADRGQAAER